MNPAAHENEARGCLRHGVGGVSCCALHMSDCFPCTDHMGDRFHLEAGLVISVLVRGDVSAQVKYLPDILQVDRQS